jgi:putative membrane protein
MKPANSALSVAAVAAAVSAFCVSCGSSDVRMRPDVPSDVTMTTGAPAPSAPSPGTPPNAPPSPVVEDRTLDRPFDIASGPDVSPRADSRGAPTSSRDDGPRATRHDVVGLSDADIAAVLDSAGKAERRLAREALKRATSARVRQLAQRVLSDHGAAKLEKVERSVPLVATDNATSAELTSSGARAAAGLASANDQDFDRLYIDALAGEERHLVQLLDGELIPQAQDAELRMLLQELRTSATSRLGMAEDLRSSALH